MAASPVHGDLEAVGGRHERAGPGADGTGDAGQQVLGQRDVRHRDALEQAVVDHVLGAFAGFLGGLEQRDEGPVPLVAMAGHERGHPGHGGHVQVVAAGVIDRHLVAAGVGSCGGAREGRAGGLAQRQRVEFATEQDGGAAAVGQDAHHARAADAGLDREAVLPEFVGDPLGGAVLSVGEFGLAVQVLVEGLLGGPQRLVAGQDLLDGGHYRSPPEKISRKNRNTFSTSRKIDAARNGAVATSVLVRSRWKSNMVNPAKMTRPRTE